MVNQAFLNFIENSLKATLPKNEEVTDSYEAKLLAVKAKVFQEQSCEEPSLKDRALEAVNNYMKWKLRKWKAITKIESTKMHKSILTFIENEEIICKICAKSVITKNIKDHSLLCKSRAELIIQIKEKVDVLKNELLVWLFEDRRKVSLEILILK